MKYDYLLFDFDNTLVDFDLASKKSLWQSFEEFGIECTEDIYKVYKKVNGKCWAALEKKKITGEELRPKRFEQLFKKLDISPTSPEEFSVRYLENLVHKSLAYNGVHELLDQFKPNYKLGIITNGFKEVQRPRLKKLELNDFFDSIVVSDEIGVSKPHLEYFEYVENTFEEKFEKDRVLVIGDSLNSDIGGGINFGVDTCWISHGRDLKGANKPTFIIRDVLKLTNILNK